ncbi:HMG box protein [Cordyceps javanica]|uniref:HMG box protein n=1 Tax=Cordyceps javanica TaxID=43265 RepID=A0A545VGL6_9HYPO|nr:HMG box protein [Cordyceps javanica]TQW12055.1 HMG box protein [Cordyceps javanica]
MSPSGYTHGDTPQKAMVRGALSYLRATGLVVNKTAVFRHFGLSRAQGYSAITAQTTRAEEPDWVESRGRPAKISKPVLKFLEYLLWNDVGTGTAEETALTGPERAWSEESRDSGSGGGGSTTVTATATTTSDGTGGDDDSTTTAVVALTLGGPAAAGAANAASIASTTKINGPTWESMIRQGRAFGLQTTFDARTMRRAMGTLLYRRCLRCDDTWVNPRHRTARVEYARARLKALTNAEDWKRVRFSAELHFAFGMDGRVRLLPRPGEKYACPTCQTAAEQQEKQQQQQQQQLSSPLVLSGWDRDIRRVHAWAAVGHGYRSELVFYDEQTGPKSLGIMAPAAYRSVILEQHVQGWPVDETTTAAIPTTTATTTTSGVIWEEEQNPHAAGGNAIDKTAEAWKDARRLRRHRGCPDAPDLCPLDVIFPPGKQWVMEPPLQDWEPATLRRAARQAWAAVSQERVDLWVELMPRRLEEVITSGGNMVTW